MNRKVICFVMSALLIASCKKERPNFSDTISYSPLSKPEMDAIILRSLKETHVFNWSQADENMVWSALQSSDHLLSVGYCLPGMNAGALDLTAIKINDHEWTKCRNELLSGILQMERNINPVLQLKDIIPWEEKVLPVFDVIIYNPETLHWLRNHHLVRYAEPMGYEPSFKEIAHRKNQPVVQNSSSGCGSNTAAAGLVANVDYLIKTPNSLQSWNYSYHQLPVAWTRTTGAGVKIFLIDTGCEYDQENLNSTFNQGSSSGRVVEHLVTLPQSTFLGIPTGSVETPDDGCGHGTAMAGVCAAPRGTDGNAFGVAYNSHLVTCRAAEDVYLDDSREVKGASDAFTMAANRTDVKIISMSMGRITSSSQLRDAVTYAYGKNKLIFCAAGTSLSWTSGWWGVIFPATMTQVNAVTGVRDTDFNMSCTDCHDGAETDFTIVMERSSDEHHPLSLAMNGDKPSTIGGSSVATATAAGIAALVWSRFPAYSRDQVLNKMITTSNNYPNRNASLGWGNLNADAATR